MQGNKNLSNSSREGRLNKDLTRLNPIMHKYNLNFSRINFNKLRIIIACHADNGFRITKMRMTQESWLSLHRHLKIREGRQIKNLA